MSLDDRDWYREAIRERDKKQKRKVVDFNKRSKQYSHWGNAANLDVNAKADGLLVIFFVLFWVSAFCYPIHNQPDHRSGFKK